MKVMTKRFGALEVDEEQVLTFPDGLIGFQDFRKFIVIDLDGDRGAIKWLQSIEEPSLGFVILDPRAVFPDYDPEFSPEDLVSLGVTDPNDLVLLSVVTVPREISKMTANLQAPLLINPWKKVGKQVITTSPAYTTKHGIFLALRNLMKRTG